MVFIKYGTKKIPFDFNAKACEKFEETLDVSYVDVIGTKRIKYMIMMAWCGIEEGFLQQGKEPTVTIEDLRNSSMTDADSLLFKVMSAHEEAEKK